MSESKRPRDGRVALGAVAHARRPVPGTPVVRMTGRLSTLGLADCRRLLDEALADDATDVVLELRSSRCDASDVSVLALMRRYVARHGGRLHLSTTSHAALRQLYHQGLADLFPVTELPGSTPDGATLVAS